MLWIVLTVLLAVIFAAGIVLWRGGSKALAAATTTDSYVTGGMKARRLVGIIAAGTALVVFLIVTALSITYQVDSREVAALRQFGEVTGASNGAGVKFKAPWVSAEKYGTAVRKKTYTVAASAKDTQEIGATIGLQYRVNPARVVDLAKNVGPNWEDVLIPDRVQQIVKDNMVKYATIEVAPNRAKLSLDTAADLQASLDEFGITVDRLFYVNLTFPDELTASITAKQVAQQDALRALQLVTQRENEAQAAVKQAEGQAKSNRLVAASLKVSPELLQLRKAELQVEAITALAQSPSVQLVPSNLLLTRQTNQP